jgi:hypothetical protein
MIVVLLEVIIEVICNINISKVAFQGIVIYMNFIVLNMVMFPWSHIGARMAVLMGHVIKIP